METLTVDDVDAADLAQAREAAIAALGDRIGSPVVISWYDSREQTFAPDIPGGDPQDRWRDYGESFGGSHEVVVGRRFHFVFGESEHFTGHQTRFVKT